MVAPPEIWKWLEEVPDPEIPVLSVVDLGIVREVHTEEGGVVVTITPTYSGCPATQVIARDIAANLRAHGITELRLETRLSPPWTTAWLSAKGREQLRQFGIAPPCMAGAAVEGSEAGEIRCPHCNATHTERLAEFGSTPCKALYRCLDCREPFDYFKPI